MREIVFRGKAVEFNSWVAGSLTTVDGQPYILTFRRIVEGKLRSKAFGVVPETIGQYVGLKDRDGTKIFEGDILESPVKRVDQSHGNLILIDDIRTCQFAALCVSEYKVIGNVHDNPELLEGTQYERSKIHVH